MRTNMNRSTIILSSRKRAREEEHVDPGRLRTIRRTGDTADPPHRDATSIHDLSVELLCQIFSHLSFCAPGTAADGTFTTPSWLVFMLVCRHMHGIAVQLKEYWVDIPLMSARMTEMALQRSSPLLVNLRGDNHRWIHEPHSKVPPLAPCLPGMSIALESLLRVRSVWLDKNCDRLCFELLCLSLSLGSQAAPNLDVLSIRDMGSPPADHALPLSALPRPTIFHLLGLDVIPWLPWSLFGPQLRTLHLDIPIWSSPREMADTLSLLSGLHTLKLGRSVCQDTTPSDATLPCDVAFLPTLHDLEVDGWLDVVLAALPHRAQLLRSVRLNVHDVQNVISRGRDPIIDIIPALSADSNTSFQNLSLSLTSDAVVLNATRHSSREHGLPDELSLGLHVESGRRRNKQIHALTKLLLSVVIAHPAFRSVRQLHTRDAPLDSPRHWHTLRDSPFGGALEEVAVAGDAAHALLCALCADPALFPALHTLHIRKLDLVDVAWRVHWKLDELNTHIWLRGALLRYV